MGHGADTSEQGGEQVPKPVRYDVRKGETGRRCCRTHSGRSSRQQGPPRNLHRKRGSRKQRANKREKLRDRFGSTSSSLREIISSSSSPPFIARKEAVCIQFFTNRIQPLDPRMYLLRPYMLLGARVCEESVHTPWCSTSTLGRFSSRQRSGCRPSEAKRGTTPIDSGRGCDKLPR